jgi:hypothetical protein
VVRGALDSSLPSWTQNQDNYLKELKNRLKKNRAYEEPRGTFLVKGEKDVPRMSAHREGRQRKSFGPCEPGRW